LGSSRYGGDSSEVADKLTNIKGICPAYSVTDIDSQFPQE